MRKLAAILATSAVALCAIVVYGASPQQLNPSNAVTEAWSPRNPATSQGKVLWTNILAGNFEGDDVLFFDGTSVSTVQALGGLSRVNDGVIALGTGPSPGDVIGLWRRGDISAWVWTRTAGGATTLNEVTYTNPIDPANSMNPEGLAIADGCVFLVLQPVANIKHVFRVNTATGASTLLTSGALVPGAPRVTTSGCKAAWVFDDNTGASSKKLQFYDGATVTQVDTGDLDSISAQLNQGKLVYVKTVSGIPQIFLYDSTQVSPSPVQLSADATGLNAVPRTDGRHVAWVHQEVDGTTWNVVLNGGLSLTNEAGTRPQINTGLENTFQLQRGQLLWKDTSGVPRYYASGRLSYLPISPATTFDNFWLADGFVAWLGEGGSDAGADREAFRLAVTAPADAAQPAAPLAVQAVPGANQATVRWDQIVGASSYNVYMAQQPGVTKDNYQTLVGGTRFTGATSPFVATGLNARGSYHFVVTTVEGATEGPNSPEAHASLTGSLTWTAAPGLTTVNVRTVAADRANPAVAYAAGNIGAVFSVYKTTNSGANWSALAGGIESLDIRAVAADGLNVYAATRDGDIWRSVDGGAGWTREYDGNDIGEQNKALVIDPSTPSTLYAGNFELPGQPQSDSYLIKSTDSGDTWVHLPEPAVADAEQRAYAFAIDPFDGMLYAGDNAPPTLAKSSNGGAEWTAIVPATGSVLSLAADSRQATSLYAGMMKIGNTISWGIYKSTTEGASWALKNAGLPVTVPRVTVLMADPVNPAYLHAGTDAGYFFSLDGAENWSAANTGLPPADLWVNALAMTGSRRLLAASASGLFILDLSTITNVFTDNPLTPGSTIIKVVHITELRSRINAVRAGRGLGAFSFTDPTITPGTTVIRSVHITDLRTALSQAYVAAKLTPPAFTDPDLAAGATTKAVHIAELRAAVIAIE